MAACAAVGISGLCLFLGAYYIVDVFFFSSRRRHTRLQGDWSSDVCSSDLSRTFLSSGARTFGFMAQACEIEQLAVEQVRRAHVGERAHYRLGAPGMALFPLGDRKSVV